jgi:hypothetical protein
VIQVKLISQESGNDSKRTSVQNHSIKTWEFEQALSLLETPDLPQHPRKILSEKNALLTTIQILQQEIADHHRNLGQYRI